MQQNFSLEIIEHILKEHSNGNGRNSQDSATIPADSSSVELFQGNNSNSDSNLNPNETKKWRESVSSFQLEDDSGKLVGTKRSEELASADEGSRSSEGSLKSPKLTKSDNPKSDSKKAKKNELNESPSEGGSSREAALTKKTTILSYYNRQGNTQPHIADENNAAKSKSSSSSCSENPSMSAEFSMKENLLNVSATGAGTAGTAKTADKTSQVVKTAAPGTGTTSIVDQRRLYEQEHKFQRLEADLQLSETDKKRLQVRKLTFVDFQLF